MRTVMVTVARTGQEFELDPTSSFTFGRHEECTVVLDSSDSSISRFAGMLTCENGTWFVTNLSETRPIRLIDDVRHTSRTLPVSAPQGPPSRFALGEGDVTIAVPGAITHNLIVSFDLDEPAVVRARRPEAVDPSPLTNTVVVVLTPRQRDVLNILARGYVQPHPRFNPEPLTYAQVGQRLRISPSRVERHVADIRARMMDAQLPELNDLQDARRRVCELAVALHLVTTASVAALETRLANDSTT
jgi:DNA-binding CsgD family transcriptional regulator